MPLISHIPAHVGQDLLFSRHHVVGRSIITHHEGDWVPTNHAGVDWTRIG